MDRPTPGRACLPGWAAVRFLTNRSTEEEHIEAFRARQMDRLRARLSRGVSTSGHGTSSRLRLPDVSAHSRTGKQVGGGCRQRFAGAGSSVRAALCAGDFHLATAREGADLAKHSSAVALRQFPRTLARRRSHPAAPEPTDPLPSRRLLARPPAGERARQSPRGPGRPDPEPERAGQPPGECAGSAALSGKQIVAQAVSNSLGEFQMEYTPTKRLRLYVRVRQAGKRTH